MLLWHDIARCCRESPREGCAAEGDREKGVGAGNCQVRAWRSSSGWNFFVWTVRACGEVESAPSDSQRIAYPTAVEIRGDVDPGWGLGLFPGWNQFKFWSFPVPFR